jgi:hypothetical protein
MDPIQQKINDARIPPIANTTTLAKQNQPLLRAIVNDRSYQRNGVPQSIALLDRGADFFEVVCARFAVELVASGLNLLYVTATSLARELLRYREGGELDDAIHPVLRHHGYLMIVDDCDLRSDDYTITPEVADYIKLVMGQGRGVIFCTDLQEQWYDSFGTFLPYFQSMNRIPVAGGANV